MIDKVHLTKLSLTHLSELNHFNPRTESIEDKGNIRKFSWTFRACNSKRTLNHYNDSSTGSHIHITSNGGVDMVRRWSFAITISDIKLWEAPISTKIMTWSWLIILLNLKAFVDKLSINIFTSRFAKSLSSLGFVLSSSLKISFEYSSSNSS